MNPSLPLPLPPSTRRLLPDASEAPAFPDAWALRLDPATSAPEDLRAGAWTIMRNLGVNSPDGRVFSGKSQKALDPADYYVKAMQTLRDGYFTPSKEWAEFDAAEQAGDRGKMRAIAKANIKGEGIGHDARELIDELGSGFTDPTDLQGLFSGLESVRDALAPEDAAALDAARRESEDRWNEKDPLIRWEEMEDDEPPHVRMSSVGRDWRSEERKAKDEALRDRVAGIYRKYHGAIEDERRVGAYRKQLEDENLWAVVASLKGRITDKAQNVVDMALNRTDDPTNWSVMSEFEKLSTPEQRSIAGVLQALHYGRDPSFATFLGDLGRSFADTLGMVTVGAVRGAADMVRRTYMDSQEYRDMVERRTLLEDANRERMIDWGYLGQSVIGVASTIPYMAAAAVPYVGMADMILSAKDQFQSEASRNGVDVASWDYQIGSAAFAVAYAFVEKIQWDKAFGGVSSVARRQMYCDAFHSINSALRVGGAVAGTMLTESGEEGLQNALEQVVEHWGLGTDQLKNAVGGFVEDFVGSLGTMAIIGGMGAVKQRVAYRHGAIGFDTAEAASLQSRIEQLNAHFSGEGRDIKPLQSFGREFGRMAEDWLNAGGNEAARRVSLQRWGLTAEQTDSVNGSLQRLWTSIERTDAASGRRSELESAFVGGGHVLTPAEAIAQIQNGTYRGKVETDENGRQSVDLTIRGVKLRMTVDPVRGSSEVDWNDPAQYESIVSALNARSRGDMTVEKFASLPEESRKDLVSGLTRNGEVTFAAEDGTKIDGRVIDAIVGNVAMTDAALPQTAWHETMHGVLSILSRAAAGEKNADGTWKTEPDAEAKGLVDALVAAGYDPMSERESVNEEQLSDLFQAYMTRKVNVVEANGLFDRLGRFVAKLFGYGAQGGPEIRRARTAQDRLINTAITGHIPAAIAQAEAEPEAERPATMKPGANPATQTQPPDELDGILKDIEATNPDVGKLAVAFRNHDPLDASQMAALATASGGRLTTALAWGAGYRWNAADERWQYDEKLAHPVDERDLPQTEYMGVDGKMHQPAPAARSQIVGERTPDLVAFHNVSEVGLRGMDELGGLAVPSFAVTKDTIGGDEFGDVTLLVRPEVIDPRHPTNKAFSGDAWTPSFPATKLRANEKRANEIGKRFKDIFLNRESSHDAWSQFAEGWSSVYGDGDYFQDLVNRTDDLEGTLRDRDVFKAAFLLETGREFPLPTKEEKVFKEGFNGGFLAFIDNKTLAAIAASPLADRLVLPDGSVTLDEAEALVADKEFMDRLREVVAENTTSFDGLPEQDRKDAVESWSKDEIRSYKLRDLADAIDAWRRRGGPRQILDRGAAVKAVNEAIEANQDEFAAWIKDLVSGLTDGKRYIRNEREPYTPAGKHRTFEQLHDPLTLAAAVRAMLKQQKSQGNGVFGSNPFGVAAKEFKSLDEIIKDEDRLQKLTREEVGKLKDALLHRFTEIASEYADTQRSPDDNRFIAFDRAADMLMDAYATSRGNKARLTKELNGWGYHASEDLVDRFRKVMGDMAKMPEDYFEAKAYRAVGFDEIAEALVPDNAAPATLEVLRRRGVPFRTYKAGDSADRLAKLNEAATDTNARFSISPDFAMDGTTVDALPAHLREDGRAIVAELADTPEWMTDPDGTPTELNQRDWLRREAERRHEDARYSISGVYTGSSADYDAPSLHYVGTGEGSQVYGWGLYGSSVRGVAQDYARVHASKHPNVKIGGVSFDYDALFDDDKSKEIVKTLEKEIGVPELSAWSVLDALSYALGNFEIYEDYDQALDVFAKRIREIEPEDIAVKAILWSNRLRETVGLMYYGMGSIYEQTFFTNRATPEETEAHLLKWYEPVSEEQLGWVEKQLRKENIPAAKVYDAIADARRDYEAKRLVANGEASYEDYVNSHYGAPLAGEYLYEFLSQELGSERAASEFLARAGIDGVKYPVDSYLGKVKDGDKAGWNYVSFRDDNIRVDHKWVDGAQRYSIVPVGGRNMMVVPYPALTAREAQDETKVKNLLRETIVGREFSQLGEDPGKLVKVDEDFLNEFWKSNDSEKLRRTREKLWRAKVDAAAHLDELLATTPKGTPEAPKHENTPVKQGATFYRSQTEFGVYDWRGVSVYPCQLLVLETSDGTRYAWDIVGIKKPTLAAMDSLPKETVVKLEMDARRNRQVGSLPQSASDVKRHQITPATPDELEALASHFGTTRIFSEAGYILPDGRVLDFSGRADGYTVRDFRRHVDHREITEYVDSGEEGSGSGSMNRVLAAGGIRLMPETGGIDLAVKPTAEQESQLRDYIDRFNGEVSVDISRDDGENVTSAFYRDGTRASRVLNEIKAHFDTGAELRGTGEQADGSFRYQITGQVGAESLGLRSSADAEAMERSGADRETIWRETGWWRGRDGMWRVEIPDFELVPDAVRLLLANGSARLADLIPSDSAILRAYPGLAKMRIDVDDQIRPAATNYGFKIAVARVVIGDVKWLTDTLRHEIQHSVQDIEGFARGGNSLTINPRTRKPVGKKGYRMLAGEVEARNAEFRAKMTPTERAFFPPWQTEDIPETMQIVRSVADSLPKSVTDSKSFDGVDTDTAAPRFSIATYEQGGRETLEKWILSQTRGKKATLSKEDAADILAQTDYIAGIARKFAKDKRFVAFGNWSEAVVETDEEGRPMFGVVRTNGDYAMNIDFSTVCKKRRPMDRIFARLVRDGVLTGANVDELSGEAVAGIQRVIKAHGLEVACALCFVDAKRYRLGDVAKRFADGGTTSEGKSFTGWNNLVAAQAAGGKKWADRVKRAKGKTDFESRCVRAIDSDPSVRVRVEGAQLISSEGMDRLARENPGIYELWRSYGGTSHAKDSHWDTPYNNDIIRPFASRVNDKKKFFKPEDAFAVGGVRLQSFSDFVGRMFFDYVQMFAELAGKRLPLHTYTKEPNFVKLFHLTKAKINMSLVPAVVDGGVAPGLDAKGNYAWADETFPPAEAWKLRKLGSNVGTIAVGVSGKHIRKLLRDPRIDMVIPYHASGINPVVASIRRINEFFDYTAWQNTRFANGKRYTGKEHFDFYGSLARTNDPKKTASEYLAWCDKRGLLPKFDKFRDEENYYKLLADFRLYDDAGNYAPQEAVEQKYPADLGKLVLEALKFDQKAENAYLENEDQIVREIEREILPRREEPAARSSISADPSWYDAAGQADAAAREAADLDRYGMSWQGPTFSYRSFAEAFAARDAALGIKRPPQEYSQLLAALGIADEVGVGDLLKSAEQLKADVKGASDTIASLAGKAEERRFANTVRKLVEGANAMGVEVGGNARRAWEKYLSQMRRMAKGRDYEDFYSDMRLDIGRLALAVSADEFDERRKEGEAPAERTPEDIEDEEAIRAFLDADGNAEGVDLDALRERVRQRAEKRMEEIRARRERILARLDEWRKAEEERRRKAEEREGANPPKENDETEKDFDEKGEDTEGGSKRLEEYENESVEQLEDFKAFVDGLKQDGLDLHNAGEFAAAIRLYVEDWLARETGADPKDVLKDPVNAARFRRTVVDMLRSLCTQLLDPADGKSAIVAERMLAEIPGDASPAEIQGRTRAILAFVQRNAIRQSAKKLIKDLRKTIKKLAISGKKFDETEKDLGRKITGEREQYARYLYRILDWSDGRIEKEEQKLNDIISGRRDAYESARGTDVGLEALAKTDREIHRAMEKLEALRLWGGLRRKMPGEIAMAAQQIKSWLETERDEHERRWAAWKESLDREAEALATAFSADRRDFSPDDAKFVEQLGDVLTTNFRQRLERLAVGSGAEGRRAIDAVMRRIYEGSERLANIKAQQRRRFDALLARCVEGTGMSVADFLKSLDEKIPEELNRRLTTADQNTRMTWGQVLQLLGQLEQTASYQRNIDANGRGAFDKDGNEQTPHRQLIVEALSDKPQMIRLLEELRAVYDENRKALSDAFAAVTGNPILQPDPLYLPARMYMGARDNLETTVRAWNPFGPAFSPRVRNTADFDLSVSILDIFHERQRETATALAFGVRGMELRSILARKEVQDAIAKAHGKFALRKMVAHLTDIVGDGWREPSNSEGFRKFAQKVGNFTTYSALSWNVVTMLKQMTSIPSWTALMDGGYAEIFKYICEFDRAAAKELVESPGFVARYGATGFVDMIRSEMRNPEGGNLVSRLAKAGMTLVQIGDFVPGIVVGTGVYKARKLALMRQGLNEEAARRQAATETWGLIEENQQSSRLENTPEFLRRGGFLARQVSKFATSPMMQVAHEMHTLRMWIAEYKSARDRGEVPAGFVTAWFGGNEDLARWRKRFFNQVVCNHLLMPAAFYAVSTLFGMALGDEPPDDDEILGDVLMQMVAGPWSRIFMLGMIFDSFGYMIAKLAGGEPNKRSLDNSGLAAQQQLEKILERSARIGFDMLDQDWESVRDDIVKMISQVNAPFRYAAKATQNALNYDPAKERQRRKREIRKARGE